MCFQKDIRNGCKFVIGPRQVLIFTKEIKGEGDNYWGENILKDSL